MNESTPLNIKLTGNKEFVYEINAKKLDNLKETFNEKNISGGRTFTITDTTGRHTTQISLNTLINRIKNSADFEKLGLTEKLELQKKINELKEVGYTKKNQTDDISFLTHIQHTINKFIRPKLIDDREIIPNLQQKAKNNNLSPKESYYLGSYYVNKGGKDSYRKGFDLIKSAATEGDPDGQYELARLIKKNPIFSDRTAKKEAFGLFQKSAAQGNIDAQYELACCYKEGYGIEKSEDLALEQFKSAAVKGHPMAAFNAGCILKDRGMERLKEGSLPEDHDKITGVEDYKNGTEDIREAFNYFQKASFGGKDKEIKEVIKELEKKPIEHLSSMEAQVLNQYYSGISYNSGKITAYSTQNTKAFKLELAEYKLVHKDYISNLKILPVDYYNAGERRLKGNLGVPQDLNKAYECYNHIFTQFNKTHPNKKLEENPFYRSIQMDIVIMFKEKKLTKEEKQFIDNCTDNGFISALTVLKITSFGNTISLTKGWNLDY